MAQYAPRGIIVWGTPVTKALEHGSLAARATFAGADSSGDGSGSGSGPGRPVSVLLHGAPKTGKTALAVEIARRAQVPFVKIVTSHRMIGFTETAKCAAMKKVSLSFLSSHRLYTPACLTVLVRSSNNLFLVTDWREAVLLPVFKKEPQTA